MTNDYKKIFKNGEDLKFKISDFTSPKAKRRIAKIVKRQKLIRDSIKFWMTDLEKIKINKK